MTEVKKKRIPRSVNIDAKIYNRIVQMSERLGVNVNAYLLEAIGQKLYRDESLLRIEEASALASNAGVEKIASLFAPVVEQFSEKQNPSD